MAGWSARACAATASGSVCGSTSRARLRIPTGDWRWTSVRAVPLQLGGDGSVRNWLGMTIDISEPKQAEADKDRIIVEKGFYLTGSILRDISVAFAKVDGVFNANETLFFDSVNMERLEGQEYLLLRDSTFCRDIKLTFARFRSVNLVGASFAGMVDATGMYVDEQLSLGPQVNSGTQGWDRWKKRVEIDLEKHQIGCA